HTIFSRDWSSDVCSSDLRPIQSIGIAVLIASFKKFEGRMPCKSHPNIFSKNGSPKFGSESLKCKARAESAILLRILFTSCKPFRSEERRVGNGHGSW